MRVLLVSCNIQIFPIFRKRRGNNCLDRMRINTVKDFLLHDIIPSSIIRHKFVLFMHRKLLPMIKKNLKPVTCVPDWVKLSQMY